MQIETTFRFYHVCFFSSFVSSMDLTKEEQVWIQNNKDFVFYNDDYNSRLFFLLRMGYQKDCTAT